MKSALRATRKHTEDTVLAWEPAYRAWLRARYGAHRAPAVPERLAENATLKRAAEWQSARREVERLGLVPHPTPEKDWDSLLALSAILRRTTPQATILDAGSETYSPILPSLYLYGYRSLVGLNLAFPRPFRRGPIRYAPGDITATRFAGSSFDAVCCMSVIEHGVDLDAYFREMHRILKPGGVLLTSTDYFTPRVDTGGLRAYGTAVHVFDESEIKAGLQAAERAGLRLTGPLDLACEERAVHWERLGLSFTFVLFALEKGRDGQT